MLSILSPLKTMTQRQDVMTKSAKGKSKILRTPTAQIWRSRLSWRIAGTVFMTILLVQVAILTLTVRQEEQRIP